jgi:hypothetical protein
VVTHGYPRHDEGVVATSPVQVGKWQNFIPLHLWNGQIKNNPIEPSTKEDVVFRKIICYNVIIITNTPPQLS